MSFFWGMNTFPVAYKWPFNFLTYFMYSKNSYNLLSIFGYVYLLLGCIVWIALSCVVHVCSSDLDQELWHWHIIDLKSEWLETAKKNGFSAKKLAENAKSMKFALPCRTNIVILPKVWPVRDGLPDHYFPKSRHCLDGGGSDPCLDFFEGFVHLHWEGP